MPNLDRRAADRIFITSFILLAAAEILCVLFSTLAISPDEAHYWEWSRRLDFSYYSKGPLIAYLIAASTAVFGDTALGVRFPAILCFNLFSLLIYWLLRKRYSAREALVAWFCARSMLIFTQMGILMTTDAPAALCWMLAIVFIDLAVTDGRKGAWLFFGIAAGVGVLAKYTVAFLVPSVLLFLLLTPDLRYQLKRAELYLGLLLFLLCLSPILVWNAENGWVNFAHNAGHLASRSSFRISPVFSAELLAGQLGLAGPIVFCGLCYGMYCGYRLWRKGDTAAGIYLFSSLPLLVFVVLVSLTKRVYANWPMPIYIGALLLFTHAFAVRAIGRERWLPWIRYGILLSAAISIAGHLPLFGVTYGLPGKKLQSKKLVGWRDVAALADTLQAGSAPGRTFILAGDYETASEVAFYSRVSLPAKAYCGVVDDRRMNQYDIWGGWDELKGMDAAIVLKADDDIEKLKSHFESIEQVSELKLEYAGDVINEFRFYKGRGYDGWSPPPPINR